VLIPILLFTLFASQRRAGLIGTMIAFVVLALTFWVNHRRAFYIVVVPVILFGTVYLPIFWSNTGLVGQPARALRSVVEPDKRDAASNEYRDLEKIDVRLTLESDPVFGVGFGKEFLFVVPLPTIKGWPFWHYEPHHNILWIWLKLGAHGF